MWYFWFWSDKYSLISGGSMQQKMLIAVSLLTVFTVTGCNNEGGDLVPLEKLAVTPVIKDGEFSAALPIELAGKPFTESTTASVDTINGEKMTDELRWSVKASLPMVISGWAFDQQKPPSRIYIELANSDNRYFASVNEREPRADVAKKFGIQSLEVGYRTSVSANIKPGAFRIAVLQLSKNGVSRWESPARLIIDEK